MFVLQVGEELSLSVEVRPAALVGLFQGLTKGKDKGTEKRSVIDNDVHLVSRIHDLKAKCIDYLSVLICTLTATWSFSWSGVRL